MYILTKQRVYQKTARVSEPPEDLFSSLLRKKGTVFAFIFNDYVLFPLFCEVSPKYSQLIQTSQSHRLISKPFGLSLNSCVPVDALMIAMLNSMYCIYLCNVGVIMCFLVVFFS